jgi:ribonuclease P/MRP protein subunit RPP1
VCPSTEKLFQQCCQNLDIDVISLDLSSKLPFSIKTPTVQQAVTRGISFEIRYSHALRGMPSFMFNANHHLSFTHISNGI